ncbi:MAG: cyclodeaminase/cyclohydrolase family protein [Eggerthellaceae bacterium]|nr:cyclodeaminase/cyclohydrolase family protein [Eggerthellaceae bacterium]
MDTEFLEELASASSTPGGGGASAYCGAIAAALASMVCNLTIGKAKFSDVESEVVGCLGRLSILRSRLVSLVDEDAQAFGPLAAAYRMPKDNDALIEARTAAIQEGLILACEPPLAMMRAIIDVLHECDFIARNGSKMAISDAGACALIAKAALMSASLNVYINADSMSTDQDRQRFIDEADALVSRGVELADAIYLHVASEIGSFTEGGR